MRSHARIQFWHTSCVSMLALIMLTVESDGTRVKIMIIAWIRAHPAPDFDWLRTRRLHLASRVSLIECIFTTRDGDKRSLDDQVYVLPSRYGGNLCRLQACWIPPIRILAVFCGAMRIAHTTRWKCGVIRQDIFTSCTRCGKTIPQDCGSSLHMSVAGVDFVAGDADLPADGAKMTALSLKRLVKPRD